MIRVQCTNIMKYFGSSENDKAQLTLYVHYDDNYIKH